MTEHQVVERAPQSVTAFLELLEARLDGFPKRLRQCAEVTRQHLHLIAVSTVSDMARTCGVVPSVYVRFCQALGFSGYSEMQALFRARFADFRPDYPERIAHLRETGGVGADQLLAEFSEAGHKSMINLANTVTAGQLDRIARGMAEARVIHLVGLRRAFGVVSGMSYLFNQMGVPSSLHYGAGMLGTASTIFPDDVLFAVTYAPFSPESVELAEQVAGRGITLFALTDSVHCPVSEWADETLVAPEHEVGGFRALNASVTLVTALAVAVGAMRGVS